MNFKIYRTMALAIHEARKFAHDGPHHLCAILYAHGRVQSIGFNYQMKTHSKSTHPYRRIHAELDCILGNDSRILRDGILCVARVGFLGRSEVLLARPCVWCQDLIARAGIREVFYTIDNEHFGHWKHNIDSEETHQVDLYWNGHFIL